MYKLGEIAPGSLLIVWLMNSDSYSIQTPAVIQNKLPSNQNKYKMNSMSWSDGLFILVRRQETHLIKK